MKEQAKAMVLASFIGDALALGAHWMYDPKAIEDRFGRVERYHDPLPNSYHPNRKKGEFTHYGDQTFLLLQLLASHGRFDLMEFAIHWQTMMERYDGYHDHASKDTLYNLRRGKEANEAGSSSNDLAGASRIAPLVYYYEGQKDELIVAAKAQTAFTHLHPDVISAAALFAESAYEVLHGKRPMEAMQASLDRLGDQRLTSLWQKGIDLKDTDTVTALGVLGRSCHFDSAFPAVAQIVGRYENNITEALIQNVMAGGDSAGRGMLIGMLIGAYVTPDSILPEWKTQLIQAKEISVLLT